MNDWQFRQDEIWQNEFRVLHAGLDTNLDGLWEARKTWARAAALEEWGPTLDDAWERSQELARESSELGEDPLIRAWAGYTQYVRCLQAGCERIRFEELPWVHCLKAYLILAQDQESLEYRVGISRSTKWIVARLEEVALRQIWEAEGHPPPPSSSPGPQEAT